MQKFHASLVPDVAPVAWQGQIGREVRSNGPNDKTMNLHEKMPTHTKAKPNMKLDAMTMVLEKSHNVSFFKKKKKSKTA